MGREDCSMCGIDKNGIQICQYGSEWQKKCRDVLDCPSGFEYYWWKEDEYDDEDDDDEDDDDDFYDTNDTPI